MVEQKDQELEKSSSTSSTVDKEGEGTSSQVDGDGAEETRALKNRDEIITRLQKQRDRDRERMSELEARMEQFQPQVQQPSPVQQVPQPVGRIPFDWTQPEQSVGNVVDQRVATATAQAMRTMKFEAQQEKAREFMQGQTGYNEQELRQVLADNPEVAEHANTKPLLAAKLAVKIWRIEKGETDSFKKEAALGVPPSSTPTRQTGHVDLFARVKQAGEKVTDEDLDKAWGVLEDQQKQGVKIQ